MSNFISNIISQSINPHLKLNTAEIDGNLISYFIAVKTELLYLTEFCLDLLHKDTTLLDE